MTINTKIIDEILKENPVPNQDEFKELFNKLKKAIVERALEGELTYHLGYEKNKKKPSGQSNSRNGRTTKTIRTDNAEFDICIPRDRDASYEPTLIAKGEKRFKGFDEKILSMYARGMTTGEIQGFLEEMYQIDVSRDFISTVTNSVIEQVREWQNRPLDRIYAILYLDALFLNVKEEGQIIKKALYLVIGVNMEGKKELLGMWMEKNEGAKFWLRVITELKNRGLEDVYIACVDGLKGFPEAINSVFPKAQVQQCIVHLVRNSLNYVPWKDKREVSRDLKSVYQANNEEFAEIALTEFEEKWSKKYPTISGIWRRNWENIIPFFGYPAEIRKVIYTTNAIESTNRSIRKIIKNRSVFPSDDAVYKLVFMAMQNIQKKWTMPIRDWKQALNQFAILFPDRPLMATS